VIAYAIDSSAIVAYLKREPYRSELETWLGRGALTYVNLAETLGALLRLGFTPPTLEVFLDEIGISTVPISSNIALMAGLIDPHLLKGGLSLADRCCLAYAKAHTIPAVTADRVWSEIAEPLGVDILQIRD
jgi:PIN domain nuclease of toxin-antitoxin system